MKRELLKSLQICKTSECKQVQKDYEIGRLDENGIDYDQVIEMIYKHTAVEMNRIKILMCWFHYIFHTCVVHKTLNVKDCTKDSSGVWLKM